MPTIAGLSYHKEGDCWICDDRRLRATQRKNHIDYRIYPLTQAEKLHFGLSPQRKNISIGRFVYLTLNGYTNHQVLRTCGNYACINPDHFRLSTLSTITLSDKDSICINCMSLLLDKPSKGKMVYCAAGAYNGGKPFPSTKALENFGHIRPQCILYDPSTEHGKGHHWSKEDYEEIKIYFLALHLL